MVDAPPVPTCETAAFLDDATPLPIVTLLPLKRSLTQISNRFAIAETDSPVGMSAEEILRGTDDNHDQRHHREATNTSVQYNTSWNHEHKTSGTQSQPRRTES